MYDMILYISAAASSEAAFFDHSVLCEILRFNFAKLLLYFAKWVIMISQSKKRGAHT